MSNFDPQDTPLLEVNGLTVSLSTSRGYLEAVRDVSFSLASGEVLGLVGESGSGKSITMRAIMGLLPLKARITGSVRFAGRELIGLPDRALRPIRGKDITMIFQDPMTALNPVLTVGDQLGECIRIHQPHLTRSAVTERSIELLSMVAIPMPAERLTQYPHEFSGGMRQRVTIAIAMANSPKLIIADEPTTALDVTVQAQILEVLDGLRRDHGVSIVLITHDLGVVAGMANRVAVMYAGRVVERGTTENIFDNPGHPYTSGLIDSLPLLDSQTEHLRAIPGTAPSLANRPSGCPFHPRCRFSQAICITEEPQLRPSDAGMSACHFTGKLESIAP
ncbi:ABC transporter ATP-binding protein [Agrobacterium sp. T29]|uniref:ABC transporter ATP-binding protein n=1 Tax=Agrobacterium sp. T29 TaxID=2580515 RepID=UPI00115DB089|nr:ABC transporter ATP-binding protein [Agrobacterium sp. T29]